VNRKPQSVVRSVTRGEPVERRGAQPAIISRN
jgi:hypothetical protein